MDKITVSDLFFNSKEAEGIEFNGGLSGYDTNAVEQAEVFLAIYPALKEVFSAEELVKDFLNRV